MSIKSFYLSTSLPSSVYSTPKLKMFLFSHSAQFHSFVKCKLSNEKCIIQSWITRNFNQSHNLYLLSDSIQASRIWLLQRLLRGPASLQVKDLCLMKVEIWLDPIKHCQKSAMWHISHFGNQVCLRVQDLNWSHHGNVTSTLNSNHPSNPQWHQMTSDGWWWPKPMNSSAISQGDNLSSSCYWSYRATLNLSWQYVLQFSFLVLCGGEIRLSVLPEVRIEIAHKRYLETSVTACIIKWKVLTSATISEICE
jgi:hypothetical protein